MKKYLIIASLFFCQIAYALENQYKSFGGRTISDGSTFGDYVAYYFNFFLVIAAGAAFIIIVFGGINYLISGDNFSKRLIAKKMIFNALFGLLITLGTVVILNTINPDSETTIPPLNTGEYSEGINLIKATGKTWVNDNMGKTTEAYTSIEWLSPSEDLPAIYVFPSPEYAGVSQEVSNGSSISIPVNSSIWFVWNKPGSYILYDGLNFKKGTKSIPLSSMKDKIALSVDYFNDVTKSIKINKPKTNTGVEYGLILFSKERFEGTCAWSFDDIPNLSVTADPQNYPPIGLDKLSSVKRIVSSTKKGTQVTLYNRASCQDIPNDGGGRKCTISDMKQNIDIAAYCQAQGAKADFTGEEVLSISFDSDNAGVLLKASNDNCQYFEKSSVNKCVSLIKYGNIYDPDNKILPAYLTLFSLDK